MQFDIAIIGAGLAGASLAAELSAACKVVVLEQESRPAYHATGRSAALYSEVYGNAAIRALTRASRGFLAGANPAGTAFAHRRGFLHIATQAQAERLDAFAALADVAPLVRRLDAAQARALVPALRPGYLACAAIEPEASDLDVDAIHQHYLKVLRAHGGTVLCAARLSAAEHTGAGWQLETAAGPVAAGLLVNAAGAWGDVIADLAGVPPIGLAPCKRTALLVDPPAGCDVRAWPAVIDIDEQFYFKPEAGKLLLSPADETPSEPCDAFAEELDLAIAVDRVEAAAALGVRRVSHSWAGLRTFTPDRVPAVGFGSGAPDFFWLAGQGGYGIQTAPALARLGASLILGRPVPADIIDEGLDLASLVPGRFQG